MELHLHDVLRHGPLTALMVAAAGEDLQTLSLSDNEQVNDEDWTKIDDYAMKASIFGSGSLDLSFFHQLQLYLIVVRIEKNRLFFAHHISSKLLVFVN